MFGNQQQFNTAWPDAMQQGWHAQQPVYPMYQGAQYQPAVPQQDMTSAAAGHWQQSPPPPIPEEPAPPLPDCPPPPIDVSVPPLPADLPCPAQPKQLQQAHGQDSNVQQPRQLPHTSSQHQQQQQGYAIAAESMQQQWGPFAMQYQQQMQPQPQQWVQQQQHMQMQRWGTQHSIMQQQQQRQWIMQQEQQIQAQQAVLQQQQTQQQVMQEQMFQQAMVEEQILQEQKMQQEHMQQQQLQQQEMQQPQMQPQIQQQMPQSQHSHMPLHSQNGWMAQYQQYPTGMPSHPFNQQQHATAIQATQHMQQHGMLPPGVPTVEAAALSALQAQPPPPPNPSKPKALDLRQLLLPPKCRKRPNHLLLILRGLPGSGKSHIAKTVRQLELTHCGMAPRIHSIDDYFMVDVEREAAPDEAGASSSSSRRGGAGSKRRVLIEQEYQYDAAMEASYWKSLMKALGKTVTAREHSLVVLDAPVLRADQLKEAWMLGQGAGYEIIVVEALTSNPEECFRQNIHGRSHADIRRLAQQYELPPSMYTVATAAGLFRKNGDSGPAAADDVDMAVDEQGVATNSALSAAEQPAVSPRKTSAKASRWESGDSCESSDVATKQGTPTGSKAAQQHSPHAAVNGSTANWVLAGLGGVVTNAELSVSNGQPKKRARLSDSLSVDIDHQALLAGVNKALKQLDSQIDGVIAAGSRKSSGGGSSKSGILKGKATPCSTKGKKVWWPDADMESEVEQQTGFKIAQSQGQVRCMALGPYPVCYNATKQLMISVHVHFACLPHAYVALHTGCCYVSQLIRFTLAAAFFSLCELQGSSQCSETNMPLSVWIMGWACVCCMVGLLLPFLCGIRSWTSVHTKLWHQPKQLEEVFWVAGLGPPKELWVADGQQALTDGSSKKVTSESGAAGPATAAGNDGGRHGSFADQVRAEHQSEHDLFRAILLGKRPAPGAAGPANCCKIINQQA
eukprot:GHRR01004296.1.p1 GENE.GHRR01004296.1~~GHRR01004296.1.p1  ORF type:complete len:958 (+),score=345.87 GHRR01004296.1:210-3083(+)